MSIGGERRVDTVQDATTHGAAVFERLQVVVLSHNRQDSLPTLVRELLIPAARLGVQITIVDNGSENPVREFLEASCRDEHIDMIFVGSNAGVAGGRNLGFRRSNREFVVYLDDDALMDIGTLEKVPLIFDEMPDAGILAFRVVHGETGLAQNDHGEIRAMVGNFHGAGHAIRRKLFNEVGFLDERCFFGAEEIELSMRALTKGWKTVFVPEILVRHFSISRAGATRTRRRIEWARNYAMVLFRYLPRRTATLFTMRLLLSYIWWGIKDLKWASFALPYAVANGAIRGMRSRNPLPADGVRFYRDPATRPEIGNVAILSKCVERVVLHLRRSSH
jgi:GT2 family glycosyltransferase